MPTYFLKYELCARITLVDERLDEEKTDVTKPTDEFYNSPLPTNQNKTQVSKKTKSIPLIQTSPRKIVWATCTNK
jgi:hypothetical protein